MEPRLTSAPPRRARLRTLWPIALLLAPAASPALAADGDSWRIAHGEVRVVCPMTVGGSFEAKTAAIQGAVALARPGVALGGEISVDLSSLDTGIGLRNQHLRERYLEVGRGPGFDRAILSEIRLGVADPRGFEGKTTFNAAFVLHGIKQAIGGSASIRREGRAVRVEASFPVVVSRFGIPKPQYLGVGVRDEVNVQVTLVAEPNGGTEAGR